MVRKKNKNEERNRDDDLSRSSSTWSEKPEAPELRRLITLHFRTDGGVCHSCTRWPSKWRRMATRVFFPPAYTNRLWQSVQMSRYPHAFLLSTKRWPPPLLSALLSKDGPVTFLVNSCPFPQILPFQKCPISFDLHVDPKDRSVAGAGNGNEATKQTVCSKILLKPFIHSSVNLVPK